MTAKLRFTPGLANSLVRERRTLQEDLMNTRSELVRGQREASQKEAQLRERTARLEEELSTLQTTLAVTRRGIEHTTDKTGIKCDGEATACGYIGTESENYI